MAGLNQHSPNRYFKDKHVIEIQKLPVTAKVAKATGKASAAPKALTYDIIFGFFLEYLSQIIPPISAEAKPSMLKLKALINANSDLYKGYIF